MCIVDTLAFV